jgi:RNA polymerase subunit RPABC4/transcription elongation factor Spt4
MEAMDMAVKRTTRESIEKLLAEHRPEWRIALDDWEPRNADEKVPLLCERGHRCDKKPGNIRAGCKCKECVTEDKRREGGQKFIDVLEAEGYDPLFAVKDYVNAKTPMPVRCPNGSEWSVRYEKFAHSRSPLRCSCEKCRAGKKRTRTRWTPETAAAEMLERGFRIDPVDYVNTHTKIRGVWVECGHKAELFPYNVIGGRASCAKCAGRAKKTTEEYRQEVEAAEKGYTLAPGAEYVNNDTKIAHTCDRGHTFEMSPSNFLSAGARCPECARLALSERWSGANNPGFDPSLTDEERREREEQNRDPALKSWAKRVKRRDGEACRVCGSTDTLHAHHLYAKTASPWLRVKDENGVTLCGGADSCHNELHQRYGFGDNTPDQFIEWLRGKLERGEGDPVTIRGLIRDIKARDLRHLWIEECIEYTYERVADGRLPLCVPIEGASEGGLSYAQNEEVGPKTLVITGFQDWEILGKTQGHIPAFLSPDLLTDYV